MQTPEFLLWALEYRCPLRGDQDGTDPDRTERQLRAARAVSDARREGRVLEGLAVDPPNGFRIADALAIYGGEEAAGRACGDCPANALAGDDHPLLRDGPPPALPQLAGCYGCVQLPCDASQVHAAIEQGIDSAYGSVPWEGLCHVTTPRWYGLWIDSPLAAEHLLVRFLVLQAAAIDDAQCRRDIADLLVALNVAFNAGLRIYVQLHPPGRVERSCWRLASHCPRCKAPWSMPDARNATEGVPYSATEGVPYSATEGVPYSADRCAVCGFVGHPAPDKKRRARGLRPYFPLDRLLGSERAANFTARWEACRARQSQPDQPSGPPPPAPSNNPPAD